MIEPVDEAMTAAAGAGSGKQPERAPRGLLEVIGHNGRVRQRLPWHGRTLRVGRAYDNDLIIDDPYVDAHHLSLTAAADGCPEAVDLESVNGILAVGSRQRQVRVALGQSGSGGVWLGHTRISYRPLDGQVAPTLKDVAAHGPLRLFTRHWWVWLTILLALAAMLFDAALDLQKEVTLARALQDSFVPLVGLLLWSGLWGLINFTSTQRWNLVTHLSIAAFFVVAWFLTYHGLSLLAFGLAWDAAWPWLERISRWLMLTLLLLSHMRYALRGNARAQGLAAAAMVTLGLGWGALDQLSSQAEFNPSPKVQPLIRPPAFVLRQPGSVEEFMQHSEQRFSED